jgi:probable F420-dependent oxidoreductase
MKVKTMISDVDLGVTLYKFPSFGPELEPLFTFVKQADDMGFKYLHLLDHVVGIVAEKHGGIAQTPYTDKSAIREVFTLMAYLSAITSKITFVTGILGLPQRQTVLVAKQAAEVDILSKGRLNLGVGVGYNNLEFDAMGADFKTRGKRFEEQVDVLRRLWTDNDVSYNGNNHQFVDVSLSPRPIQRPIPLFFGMGRSNAPIPPDAVLERAGRLADGWLPLFDPNDEARIAINKVHEAARTAGRDPDKLTMVMSMDIDNPSDPKLIDEIKKRRDFGAHRISLNLIGNSAQQQIEFLHQLHDNIASASD